MSRAEVLKSKNFVKLFAGLFLVGSALLGYILGVSLFFLISRLGFPVALILRAAASLALAGGFVRVGAGIMARDRELREVLRDWHSTLRAKLIRLAKRGSDN